jgi:hypothetical protein
MRNYYLANMNQLTIRSKLNIVHTRHKVLNRYTTITSLRKIARMDKLAI